MTKISAFNRATLALAACVIGSTVSCSSDSTTSPPDVSGSRVIELLTAASVQGIAGSTIDPGPAIRLKDKRTGQPLANVKVEFITDVNAGYVDNRVTNTDASGIATAGRWVLGWRAGTAVLLVRVDAMKISFIADIKPDVPSHMRSLTESFVGFAGEMVDPLVVTVYDRFDNPTSGATVTFAIASGDGTLYNSSGVTDSFGGTTTGRWRLGSTPGENTVVASVEGLEPVSLTVPGVDPAGITRFTLDSVRSGTLTITPAKVGIVESKLSMTPFDQCLCRAGTGYYIIDVGYTNETPEPTRISGAYKIEPPLIHPTTGGHIKNIAIVDGRLEIEIERDTRDWIWKETWIYRKE